MKPLSPLRYPGAKRWLTNYIVDVLEQNGLRPKLFIEPFAGGASISLAMLYLDKVEKIGLADLDPMVTAFWKTVFFDTDWLIEKVSTCEISLAEWNRLKNSDPKNRRDLAFKCLFLNRTSFSGILHPSGGPLGGQSQTSDYKIDCRFNRTTIIERLKNVAAFSDRIEFVWNWSWKRVFSEIDKKASSDSLKDIFFYVDPPFYSKAERLYTFHFTQLQHHARLRDNLVSLSSPWLLSYDNHADIETLYCNCKNSSVDIAYTTSGSGIRKNAKELIVSNVPILP